MLLRRFAALSLLVPLAAAGCSGLEDTRERVGEAEEAINDVCPTTSVEGIDIASYQHPNGAGINWSSVAGTYKFAIVKATENNSYTNSYYAGDVAGARAAGIIAGSYHFLAPSSQTGVSGASQAAYFLAHASIKPGDLPPMLDVETSSLYGSVLPSVADVTGWLGAVQAATGVKPLIYIGYYVLGDLGNPSSLAGYPINVPSYGACPNFPNNYSTSDLVMWQFTSTQSVPGITGNVDADKFYGSMTDLQALAGAQVDWGASYVDQSWPLATTTMSMTVNQELAASITLKNVGGKSWDSNTRLGTTQPRDRSSAFAGSDWIGANRPSGVPANMTVAPGSQYEFDFNWHAPDAPGTFDEFFGVVEEGVHWFSDSGEGGPPDDDIEAKIAVVEADYHGDYVSQTYPTLADAPVQMTVGQTKHGTITLKNVGTSTWHAGTTKLAPTPRDMSSPLGSASWLSDTRVSTPTADVAPGDSFDFPVDLTASALGDFTQTFSLVEEGVTWFADAPKGGGPSDTLLAVHVVVGDASGDGGGGDGSGGSSGTGDMTSGSGGSTGTRGAGTGTGTGANDGAGTASTGAGQHGVGDDAAPTTDDHGGCAVSAVTSNDAPTGLAFVLGSIVLVAARRRRAAA
ncbi:MAG TPA: GH25 family lysozyme [Byssovorax sp.]|jgi:lysozyme